MALALLLFGAVACAVFGAGGDHATAASCTKSWVAAVDGDVGRRQQVDRRHCAGRW